MTAHKCKRINNCEQQSIAFGLNSDIDLILKWSNRAIFEYFRSKMSESEGIVKSVDGIFKVCQECLAYTVVEKIHAVPFLCKYL